MTKKIFLITVVAFSFFAVAPLFAADVPGWFIEEKKDNVAMLAPGTTTYCNEDFQIENMGNEMAEVNVILGNGDNYAFEQLQPKEKKSYSLKGGLPSATESGKSVWIDEARIVNSTAGDSHIKVRCK